MTLCIQDLVSICLLVLKIWSKNQTLTRISGRYSVANLQYMTHPNLDLVDEKVYTKLVSISQCLFVLMILKESHILPGRERERERERENDGQGVYRIAPHIQSRAT